ncbi:hypothetical protein F5Y10DRAFT_244470 [Nemania abortiva]|nr:hypothetical protein F5Y10DRAFT_244470 [Nemania abortiva]
MASIKSKYVFFTLSTLGLIAQWGAMVANGTLLGLMVTAWEGRFPDGVPMRTTWSGVWLIDYVLGLLVAFFYPLLNVINLDSPAPVLLMTDLLLSLAVFSLIAIVQGQRGGGTGLLKYPAVWQLAWQFFGAATVMPIYLHTYIKTRALGGSSLPGDQAQKLPFMAIWAVLTNIPLLLPGVMGASPFVIQLSIVLWFFLPLTTGFFQNGIGILSRYYHPRNTNNSIAVSYGIVGSASAIFHVAVGLWAYNSPQTNWVGIYWPAYSAVRPGPNIILQGAMLFCQYGHISLRTSVTALAVYTVGRDIFAAESSSEAARACRLAVSLIAIMGVFGPGAGAAWFLYKLETEASKPAKTEKHL